MRGLYGIIASSFRPPVAAGFNAGAVNLNNGLSLFNSAISATDSPYVAVSYWIKYPTAADMRNAYAFNIDPDGWSPSWNAVLSGGPDDGKMSVVFGNSNDGLFERFVGTNVVPLNQWHHFFIVFNGVSDGVLNNQLVVYHNRQKIGSITRDEYIPFMPQMNGLSFYVGSDGYGDVANYDMSEFWFDLGHDLLESNGTVSSATLDKFITSDLKPVNLGTNGELPTGALPLVYFHKDKTAPAADFTQNRGTGGAFVVTDGVVQNATTNPDGSAYTPPSLPSPTVVLDFKNGVYSIGGVSKTLSEVVTTDAAYGPWDPTAVVAGTGLTRSVSYGASSGSHHLSTSPVLTTAARNAVVASGVNAGFTAVVKLNVTQTGSGATYLGVEMLKDDYSVGWGAQVGWNPNSPPNSNDSSLYDYNTISVKPQLLSQGSHTYAFTLDSTQLAATFDGASPIVTGTPQSNDPSAVIGIWLHAWGPYTGLTTAGSATATIESIKFYNTVDSSVLGPLSGT
jgi:hypothetical protein